MKWNENDSHYKANGTSMIVCVCNNISDREIRQAVDLGLNAMADLRKELGVGACCGTCVSCARGDARTPGQQARLGDPACRRTKPAGGLKLRGRPTAVRTTMTRRQMV
jgi:bacterioferritin-associated ferredoxin